MDITTPHVGTLKYILVSITCLTFGCQTVSFPLVCSNFLSRSDFSIRLIFASVCRITVCYALLSCPVCTCPPGSQAPWPLPCCNAEPHLFPTGLALPCTPCALQHRGSPTTRGSLINPLYVLSPSAGLGPRGLCVRVRTIGSRPETDVVQPTEGRPWARFSNHP